MCSKEVILFYFLLSARYHMTRHFDNGLLLYEM